MAETFLILLVLGYFIYKVTFEVPKDIKRIEDKIDILKLYLQEIELKLDQINKKIDNK
ncbi:hypothetical protein RBU49_06470 [Clostridium sp. MB40-C1]|uniref:hypothetical protein n=1 Tax=Clostridium sp. MB40-C1 TaxID=3070996 RepID=UPI0027DED7DC|nr:hypothetical protein [Clostridium sp. MB40-C1]WMJ81887.1 hypothetical protein RBU49_06470 [Clostridium sp. MB40-C1]